MTLFIAFVKSQKSVKAHARNKFGFYFDMQEICFASSSNLTVTDQFIRHEIIPVDVNCEWPQILLGLDNKPFHNQGYKSPPAIVIQALSVGASQEQPALF